MCAEFLVVPSIRANTKHDWL